jgi:hypothetical protein
MVPLIQRVVKLRLDLNAFASAAANNKNHQTGGVVLEGQNSIASATSKNKKSPKMRCCV